MLHVTLFRSHFISHSWKGLRYNHDGGLGTRLVCMYKCVSASGEAIITCADVCKYTCQLHNQPSIHTYACALELAKVVPKCIICDMEVCKSIAKSG